MAFEFVTQALSERRDSDLLRARRCQSSRQGRCLQHQGRDYLNFSSNDYLGLSQHPEVVAAWCKGANEYGVGSAGSPLVTGFQSPHLALEQQLAEWFGYPAALLFSSGFCANQAVIKAFDNPSLTTFHDKLNHASLIEAGMYSSAPMKRFRHNDVAHLDQLLSRANGDKLVISEGVFSMDGDSAPLGDIAQVSKQHKAWLMIDDAHGAGVLGEKSSVSCAGLGAEDVQIMVITFGKAFGVQGAAVLCSEQLREYLLNFARSYVYSTAMPAAQASAVSASLNVMATQPQHRERLSQNIALFRKLAEHQSVPLHASNTAIQPILIGSAAKAQQISLRLKEQGLWVNAIRPPTVPPNTSRLRVTLTAHHSAEDINSLVEALVKEMDKELAGYTDEL
ncbi:8-amino-7-oxononanoate synthase [Aliagarivorans marinus]|uniref:8-amino-7-oxononanoate synthase n=1 Tax=Aliagarivorans marinus TaxID=561965 RepID=UPI0004104597|nr:8-amino-7-oxononanoate synthase [Aliagarivorans marinus]